MRVVSNTSRHKIPVGISSCLLGASVRYDGAHKFDPYINGTLGHYFEFVPVCPEVAIGLGAPRPPIRLVGDPTRPRVIGVKDPQLDVTDKLEAYGVKMASALTNISGYILKRASPSCGMQRVKVYGSQGNTTKNGVGAYARSFMRERPLLPVEEEGRLGDLLLRENFIQRVFVFYRWQILLAKGLTAAGLVEFHSRHKFILMAHSQAAYRRLGRLVAHAGVAELQVLAQEYATEMMTALKRRATRKQHCNVLMHLLRYLKNNLDRNDKAELIEMFEAYRRGELPLIVPITLLQHHFRRHPNAYVTDQYYLQPYPQELTLRNQI